MMTMSLRGLPRSILYSDLPGMDASGDFLNTPPNILGETLQSSHISQAIPQNGTRLSGLADPAAFANPVSIPAISQSAGMETHDGLSTFHIGHSQNAVLSFSAFSGSSSLSSPNSSVPTGWAEDQLGSVTSPFSVPMPSQSFTNGPNQVYGQISTNMVATFPHAIPSNANVAAPYGAQPFENINNVLYYQHLHTGSVGYAPTIEDDNAMVMYEPSSSSAHTYSHLPGNNSTASIFDDLTSADKDSANASIACVPSLPEQHPVPQQMVSRDKVRPVSRKTTARSQNPFRKSDDCL
jgi:hypothetical protein